ncbi:MAG: sulfurtransferase [Chloroflexi bacterium]|nr:sulfurtransferase [Chloroflexota bacterium]
MATSTYAHPEVLVETDWVAEHLNDAGLQLVEADEDILLYEQGHIPGAVKLDWLVDVQNPLQRDFVDKAGFEAICSRWGIANDTLVVFYGDRNNWYAAYSFWLFRYYGHTKAVIMNGGRAKWVAEGRPLTREVPSPAATTYTARTPDDSIRAFRDDIQATIGNAATSLVDVRSPAEYSGEKLHMEGYEQEGAQRAGHVPGAKSIPWATAANADGTFKSADELKAIYEGKGVTADKPTIAYCRIGERSAHTWFVLTQLLGHSNVRNYDGSWTEWGSLVRAPIEKGA